MKDLITLSEVVELLLAKGLKQFAEADNGTTKTYIFTIPGEPDLIQIEGPTDRPVKVVASEAASRFVDTYLH